MKFQRSEYNVLEDDGSVVVCVELVGGPLAGNVAILVQSQSGTAVGKTIIIIIVIIIMYNNHSICDEVFV